MPKITGFDHLVLTVADIPTTVAFYEALGTTPEVFHPADGSTRTALTFGSTKINLHAAKAPFKPHAHRPTTGSADLCLLTTDPLTHWQSHLASLNIPIEQGPIARTGATGPITSIYIRDPDQNLIEIASYG